MTQPSKKIAPFEKFVVEKTPSEKFVVYESSSILLIGFTASRAMSGSTSTVGHS